MNQLEIEKKLAGEISRRGLSAELAGRIAANLSGAMMETVNNFQRGSDMVELLGAVSISDIQKRINAEFPRISATDYGAYSVVSNIIKNHPDWTADQVYAEARKSFMPASAGGLLVVPPALQQQRTNRQILIVGSLVALAGIAWFTRKRATID